MKSPIQKDHFVAEILKLPHLGEDHHMPKMQVRRRGVEAAFHPQGASLPQPLQQLLLAHQVHRAATQLAQLPFRRVHGASIYEMQSAIASLFTRPAAAPLTSRGHILSRRAGAEQGGAQAHQRGAAFDGGFEVGGHAHGQRIETQSGSVEFFE